MSGTDITGDERRNPRRRMMATGLVMGLMAGGTAGLVLGTPLFVAAEDDAAATSTTLPNDGGDEQSDAGTTNPHGSGSTGETNTSRFVEKMQDRFSEALSDLVEDGTITREQADAVIDALTTGRQNFRSWADRIDRRASQHPKTGDRFGGFTESFRGMRELYEKLDMSAFEVAREMMDGHTIADIAADRGISRQDLIDAAIEPMRVAMERAVTDGHLTRERADERLRRATEAITDMIDGDMPRIPEFRGPRHHGGDAGGTKTEPGD